jgi:diaminopropionate ammonia-lyase
LFQDITATGSLRGSPPFCPERLVPFYGKPKGGESKRGVVTERKCSGWFKIIGGHGSESQSHIPKPLSPEFWYLCRLIFSGMCEYLINTKKQQAAAWMREGYGAFGNDDIGEFHRSLAGYAPTPLLELPNLAAKAGLKNIYVKDEGGRFGVKAFKPLGASYCIFRFLKEQWLLKYGTPLQPGDFSNPEIIGRLGAYTFCAATDGNHGKAVAWTANKLQQHSVIYMPANTAPARVQNIKAENADVVLVEGTFDECVEQCSRDAHENNWQVISDTAYPGNMDLPYYVMAGYSTIFHEMEGIINHAARTDVDLVILQAGVGGLAAAGCWYFRSRYGAKSPQIVCMEPVLADSFLESAKNGKVTPSQKNYESIMAGLNCGVSHIAFPVVMDSADVFISAGDNYAETAMRQYYFPEGSDPRIISGESGASGLAGLLALLTEEKLRGAKDFLKPGKETSVLIINTEADTDPENFAKIISQGKPDIL